MKNLAAAVIVLSASVLAVAGALTNNPWGIAIFILAFVVGLIGMTDYCRSWKNDGNMDDSNNG